MIKRTLLPAVEVVERGRRWRHDARTGDVDDIADVANLPWRSLVSNELR